MGIIKEKKQKTNIQHESSDSGSSSDDSFMSEEEAREEIVHSDSDDGYQPSNIASSSVLLEAP